MANSNHAKPRKKGGALKIVLVIFVLLILAIGAAALFAYNEINGNGGKPGVEVTVSIPQGSSVASIANQLKEARVIRSSYLFRWYVGYKGAAGKLQYGDFTLQTGAYSYDGLIEALSEYAKAESVRLTFPEGTTAIAIAQKMEQAGLCTAKEFLEEANTGDFSEYTFWQYVPDDTAAPDRFLKCEGYLFPDTYEFLADDTVHNYVATFYSHFDQQFTDAMYKELDQQGLSLSEVITLASFVQRRPATTRTTMWPRSSETVWQKARPTPSCKAIRPAMSRAMQTTTISGTGWPLVRRLGEDPRKHPQCLRHLHLHRPARRADLEPRSGRHPGCAGPPA